MREGSILKLNTVSLQMTSTVATDSQRVARLTRAQMMTFDVHYHKLKGQNRSKTKVQTRASDAILQGHSHNS